MSRDKATPGFVLRTLTPGSAAETMMPAPYKARRLKGAQSRKRRWVKRGVALVLATVAVFLTSGFAAVPNDSAAAWNPLDPCPSDDMSKVPANGSWPGALAGLTNVTLSAVQSDSKDSGSAGTVNPFSDDRNTKFYQGNTSGVTPYEWFGSAGQGINLLNDSKIVQNDSLCVGAMNKIFSIIPQTLLQISQLVSDTTLTVLSWALTASPMKSFIATISSLLTAMRDTLFLTWLIPLIMIGALWGAWQAIVKKRTSTALQGIAWTLIAGSVTVWFLANPAFIVRNVDGAVSSLATTIAGSATDAAGQNLQGMCTLPAGSPDKGLRQVQCGFWETFVYTPWARAQFGDGATVILTPEANGVKPLSIPGTKVQGYLPLLWLDALIYNHDEAVARELMKPLGVTSDYYPRTVTDEQDRKAKFAALITAIEAAPEGSPLQSAWAPITGEARGNSTSAAFFGLLASLVGSVPILVIALSYVAMEIGFVFLILVAPLFLTLGIHPGFGRKIALGWLEMVISNLIKRLALAMILSVLLGVFQIVQGSTDNWFIRVLLLSVSSIAVLTYRGQLLGLVSRVNLNGTNADTVAMQGALRNAGTTATRAVGGAVGGLSIQKDKDGKRHLGNPVTGAVKGATFGRNMPLSQARVAFRSSRNEVRRGVDEANDAHDAAERKQKLEEDRKKREAARAQIKETRQKEASERSARETEARNREVAQRKRETDERRASDQKLAETIKSLDETIKAQKEAPPAAGPTRPRGATRHEAPQRPTPHMAGARRGPQRPTRPVSGSDE